MTVVIDNVTKRFGETLVLDRINAEIREGSFAVLVGPSGCGKSTLLRLIAGLEEVTSGHIRFGGRDVTHLPPRDRELAMVFQSYALYPHMTVRDNIAFGLKLRKLGAEEIARRVAEVADILGLGELLDRHPRALSGGQRQRVAMGRAIAKRSKLLLLDEPLSNLDPALRNRVRADIRRLHDDLGATSIYVTHDQVEAMTLADQLFVLDGGIVQQTGRPLDIYREPANRFVAGFVGSPAMNFLDGVVTGEGGDTLLAIGQNADSIRIKLSAPERFGSPRVGDKVTLGVRPQDVELAVNAHSDDSANVDGADLVTRAILVETLGHDMHVHTSVAGQPFVACLDGDAELARGDVVRLRITALHLFDRETGQSLRASGA